MSSRRPAIAGMFACACVSTVLDAAHASPPDEHWNAPAYELGIVRSTLPFGDGLEATGTGVRLTEQSGWITPVTVGAPVGLFMALTVQDQEVTGVRKVYEGDDAILERTECTGSGSTQRCTTKTYRTKRNLVDIQVDTRPLPPEVVAAQIAARERALDKLVGRPMHFDLTYFPNLDDGSIHGVDVSWYPVSVPMTFLLRFDVGYTYTRLTAEVPFEDGAVKRRIRAHAVPLRVTIKPVLWAYATAELGVNMLGFADEREGEERSSFARFAATIKPPRSAPVLHRAYLRAGADRRGLSGGGAWGVQLEAGLSF